MIVPVSSEKYDDLFTKASELLGLTGDDVIDNINSYYGHMKTFYEKEAYKYIMMPLDDAQGEEAFNIDLNSRAITVPAAFAKTGGVQSDQMAELVIFKVDRFFDYMDLANTFIYVQWQLPDADKTIGVTRIEMIDLTETGKIRFAWPLTQTITRNSGVVKFSVRFYVFDGQQELTYSLNTLEASLNIKPALDPTHNPSNFDSQAGLFEKAITNSKYTNDGIEPPKTPNFDYPGLDMYIVPQYVAVTLSSKEAFDADKENKYVLDDGQYKSVAQYQAGVSDYFHKEEGFVRVMKSDDSTNSIQVAKLSSNNKLTMRAQAIVSDAGRLSYQWKFKRDVKNAPWEPLGEPITDVKDLTYLPATLPVDKTNKPYLSFKDAYYVSDGNGGHTRYPATDGVPKGKDGKYNNSLYEAYAEYQVPATGDVVGTYALVATNRVSDLVSDPAWSTQCYLPGPKDIEFAENAYVVEQDKIKVNVVEDINKPDMTYAWFYDAKSAANAINLAKTTDIKANGNTDFSDGLIPGWYCVQARADLNRTKKNNYVKTAQIIYAEPAIASVKPASENPAYNLAADATQDLVLDVVVDLPQVFTDNGKTAADVAEELYKNLSFKWSYRRSDSNTWRDVTDAMIGENDNTKLVKAFDKKTGTLTVRNIEDKVAYQYKCVVTNTLGEKHQSLSLGDEDLFLIY